MQLRFVGRLGAGGYGDVWRATDELSRDLAVKIVRPSAATQSGALEHARALARAAHPNVVVVHGIEDTFDPETGAAVQAIVMEYLDGETLAHRLRHGPQMTPSEVRQIGESVIDGLEHIHSQGLVHGDLHGDNVILLERGGAKIIDILYSATLGDLSSPAREGRLTTDVQRLVTLLTDILAGSDLPLDRALLFKQRLVGLTIPEVRMAFTHIAHAGMSDADADPALGAEGNRLDYPAGILNGEALAGRSGPSMVVGSALANPGPRVSDLKSAKIVFIDDEEGAVAHYVAQLKEEGYWVWPPS